MRVDSQILEMALVLGIFFTGQLGTAIWWGSKLNTEFKNIKEDLRALTKEVRILAVEASRITLVESEMTVVKDDFRRLQERVDKFVDREIKGIN